MSEDAVDSLEALVARVDRYPLEAFLFVRDGLNYAVERIHGPENQAHRALGRYCAEKNLDWNALIAQYHAGQLDDALVQAIDAAGGCDKLNRHVGGREMCWGLRDLALERYGLLADVVLRSWNIRVTADFGRIVFAFIEHGMMQKQDDDRIEDFTDIYDFDEVFSRHFRLDRGTGEARSEEN